MATGGEVLKESVRQHWEEEACGTRGLTNHDRREFFNSLERERYLLEPYIRQFARFEQSAGKRVLEIGVGAGTDFINWVRAGANATGIDLTLQGISLTRERLQLENRTAELRVSDAESLPFEDGTFDLVYSYGVLHHSPDTEQAVAEVRRVLKPGGKALVMVYYARSWVAFMLWLIYCAGRLRPWRSARWAMYHHLESPGTKAYNHAEARALFGGFSEVSVRTQLSHADLLLMRPALKHDTPIRRALWHFYPRWLVRATGDRFGNALLIEAIK